MLMAHCHSPFVQLRVDQISTNEQIAVARALGARNSTSSWCASSALRATRGPVPTPAEAAASRYRVILCCWACLASLFTGMYRQWREGTDTETDRSYHQPLALDYGRWLGAIPWTARGDGAEPGAFVGV